MMYTIRLRRVYEESGPEDGARVLVDRLWPRGVRKHSLELSEWYKEASPTAELRRQWHAGSIDYEHFCRAYRNELSGDPEVLIPLLRYARQGRLTLLSAVRDLEHSHMPVLRQALLDALRKEDRDADGGDLSSSPCDADYDRHSPQT